MPTSIISVKFGGGLVVRHLARGLALFEVLQAGLVAVVAVGDEDRLRPHEADHGADRVRVGHDPEPVGDAEVIRRDQRRAL